MDTEDGPFTKLAGYALYFGGGIIGLLACYNLARLGVKLAMGRDTEILQHAAGILVSIPYLIWAYRNVKRDHKR